MKRQDFWWFVCCAALVGVFIATSARAWDAAGWYYQSAGTSTGVTCPWTFGQVIHGPESSSLDAATFCTTYVFPVCTWPSDATPPYTFNPAGTPASGSTIQCGKSSGGGTKSAMVSVVQGCPTGYTNVSGSCLPASCASNLGKVFEYSVFHSGSDNMGCPGWTGAGGAWDGKVCANSCKAVAASCDSMGFQLADGTQISAFSGTATQTGDACESGSLTASVTAARTADATSNPTAATAGGEGINATGASSQAWNSADSVNLARIASNTKRLADNAASSSSSSVAISEGDTSSTASATDSAMIGQENAMGTAMDTRVSAIAVGSAPSLLPGGGRWLFSLSGWLPTATCESTGTLHLGTTDIPYTLSICSWAGYVKDFAFWALSLFTVFGVWMILFRRPG